MIFLPARYDMTGAGIDSTFLRFDDGDSDAYFVAHEDGGGVNGLTLANCRNIIGNGRGGCFDLDAPGMASGSYSFDQVRISDSRAIAGGAISVGDQNGWDLVFTGCEFLNNVAETGDGGAIEIAGGSVILFDACVFKNNTSNDDGGGLWVDVNQIEVVDCLFEDNSAADDGGGAQLTGQESVDVIRTAFNRNFAAGHGGGLHVVFTDNYDVSLSTFEENEASARGGGLRVTRSTGSVFQSEFVANRASDGAGMFVYEGSAVVTDSLFQNGEASDDGGGVGLDAGIGEGLEAFLTLSGCILSNNVAGDDGSAILIGRNGTLTLVDSTRVFDNSCPKAALTTPSSIQFLDDRLFTVMEGDDTVRIFANTETAGVSPANMHCRGGPTKTLNCLDCETCSAGYCYIGFFPDPIDLYGEVVTTGGCICGSGASVVNDDCVCDDEGTQYDVDQHACVVIPSESVDGTADSTGSFPLTPVLLGVGVSALVLLIGFAANRGRSSSPITSSSVSSPRSSSPRKGRNGGQADNERPAKPVKRNKRTRGQSPSKPSNRANGGGSAPAPDPAYKLSPISDMMSTTTNLKSVDSEQAPFFG